MFATLAVSGFFSSPAKADVTVNGRSNVHTHTLCGNAPGNYTSHAISATTNQNGSEKNVWVMYYFTTDGKNWTHTNEWYQVPSSGTAMMTYGPVAMPENFKGWLRTMARIAVQTPRGWSYANDYNVEAKSFEGYGGSTTRNDGWCYVY
ncbi:MAG TPA: hypothetical protein VMZ22_01210 [Acidimicrobiales bacterium]|nr:hypothetical protein [Acidimicrobiales bacterium]